MIAICPIAALPPIVSDNLSWWIAGVVIVLGLFVYGLRDTLAISAGGGIKRAWAISGVCFAESIRKRVLWITPLAILGVVIVSQFQRPVDEADAVRQMLKVCLFATGLVVTITTVILACTNLPKEIENRVIFTIVTKPTTRLEIVVGKVIGFARVSAAILLIMGGFTLIYLWSNSFSLQRDIDTRLKSGIVESTIRPTLEYYRDTGLLTARRLASPLALQVTSRVAAAKDEMWILGNEGDVLVPFDLKPEDLVAPGDPNKTPLAGGVLVQLQVGFDDTLEKANPDSKDKSLPSTIANPNAEPRITASLLDGGQNQLVASPTLDRGQPPRLVDAAGNTPVALYVDPKSAPSVDRWNRVFVAVVGLNSSVEYRFGPNSVKLVVPPVDPNGKPRIIEPAVGMDQWLFRGRLGRVGYQLRGGTAGKEPTSVGIFSFTNAAVTPESGTGKVPFEFRCDIERSGAEDSDEQPTQLQVSVRSRETGQISEPVDVLIEANRPIFFKVPGDMLRSGNFDVLARCTTPGHYLGVTRGSVAVVLANQGFVINLFKSLFIMWLMAILVIAVSVFSSTFLSWPIAIVLTLVMLLCRWGVLQLGDALQPGIGNQVATDLGFRDPAPSAMVSKSVDALSKFLNTTAAVLPDISQFASIEDLERGVAVPAVKVGDSLIVLLTFGIPIMVLSYIILRNKEVAP